jgi:hypothetical protein
MLTITIMFMLILCITLICHASILYMLNLIHQYVMIYILVLIWELIWKLPNSLTIQKPYLRSFLELSMTSFVDALRPKKFSGTHIKRWSVKVTD